MSNELDAIRAIGQRLYDILRAAPRRGVFARTTPEQVMALTFFQEDIEDILLRHGIKPSTGPELEPING